MKTPVLARNLQIILRSQQKQEDEQKARKQEALSVFLDNKACDDLYPDTVECKRTGTWYLSDAGSQKQYDNRYKVWAIYSRTLRVPKETEDVSETQSEQVS